MATACSGCLANLVGDVVHGASATGDPHVVFHADTDFSPRERAAAEQAADLWGKQTAGVASIRIVWDLDFGDTEGLTLHVLEGHNILVRREGWMPSVDDHDDVCPQDDPTTPRNEHGCVLGWMTAGGIHASGHVPIMGSFVMDRIDGPDSPEDMMLQVMLHEFGHALGLPHVGAIQAIMYPSYDPSRTSCLKMPDLVAFCTVNNCTGHTMLPCE